MSALAVIRAIIAAHKAPWLVITAGFVVLYYAALLLCVVIRFGELPNYVTLHDYIHNVMVIARSTPSVRDMAPIIFDEWLLEIGYMNRSYGHGIAEWSIEIIPPKLLVVVAVGALVAINALLLRGPSSCALGRRCSGLAAIGVGAALVGFTSITMMWVVCCAAPSWAVALAIVGVGVSTAFGLQPFGTAITLAGFVLLLGATCLLARTRATAAELKATTVSRLAPHNA